MSVTADFTTAIAFLPVSRPSARRAGFNLDQYKYIYLVQMDRRTFLENLARATVTSVLAGSQEASGMWGMIAKITLLPGKRDEMIES